MSTEHEPQSERSVNERWYDEEIAPALAEIAQKCHARDIPMVAVVEYDPGKRGRTYVSTPKEGLAMTMLGHCAKMGENVDGYMIGLVRYCYEKGIDTSGSIYLRKFEPKYCHKCAAKLPAPEQG